MKKVNIKDMWYEDRQQYKYYKRLLGDLKLYGEHYLKEVAERIVEDIEEKYSEELEVK